jgi:hypothetical protein
LSTCCGASETVEDARWNILEHRATSMSLERYGWRLLRYSGVHRSVERSWNAERPHREIRRVIRPGDGEICNAPSRRAGEPASTTAAAAPLRFISACVVGSTTKPCVGATTTKKA